jgi:hypothetical protein
MLNRSYIGPIHRSAQAKEVSALRPDTPTQLALVDVACAPKASARTYFGVADRSAQVLASNLTYPGRYLFTQTDPYPRMAILPELVFGSITGTDDLIDCVPLEKVEGQRFANGPCCWIRDNPGALRRPAPLAGKLSLFEVPDELLRRGA